MNKIAIRVDANEIVATGHIMRCRTIAASLKQMRCAVVFVSADDNILPYIGDDYEVQILGSNWRRMESEVPVLLGLLKEEEIKTLLVDSYQVTMPYFEMLRNGGIRVMYMDDMLKEVYPVKAIVNYSPGAPELGYEEKYAEDMPMLLLGTKYIPLREQFWKRRAFAAGMTEEQKEERYGTDGELLMNIDLVADENEEASAGAHRAYGFGEGLNNIFLTTGGADSRGLSEILITAILTEPELGFRDKDKKKIHVLAGRYYRVSDKVQRYIEDGYVILHQNVDNVADIMGCCDVAITPAGTTLYELCAVGVPSVSYVFAENMEPDALYFEKKKLIPYAGDFRNDERLVIMNIMTTLRKYSEMSIDERVEIGEKLKAVIDGQGADRIAEALAEL